MTGFSMLFVAKHVKSIAPGTSDLFASFQDQILISINSFFPTLL